ncbi:hypothetical protein J0A67_06875 [Algoriphagus aestuariicola]|uniref:Uncharacterized protein n=1 Tax=Algoriphagus aestuariicola TaxID=1852016 RepID=A0ABS3BMR8_9BACT|nr:hypothetical protein [Algoriphagus aestuariicola]MBN7800576.1 hypothetical protein [Algoriphagus aestuariicola]
MKMLKIYSEDKKSFYRLFYDEDIECVNPIKYFKDRSITSSYYLIKDQIEHKLQGIPEEVRNKIIAKKANEIWKERFESISNESLDKEFLVLLSAESKKDQLKLLKGKTLATHALAKLLFLANLEFGFSFSRYTSEKLPGNIEKSQLPLLFELSDNEESVSIIGETTLKEGELKNVIIHRKNIVANFLDKGKEWHCFYLTFKALSGKESWNDGEPHYHYLSDKFGLSRKDVIQGIKDGKVPSTPVHIGIKDYRK